MKDKNVAAILALFLGGLGVHKFYLGRIGSGVLYLVFCFTVIPWVLGLIDFFVLALMHSDEFDARFNGSRTLPGPVVVNMLPPGPGYPPAYGPGPGYGPGQFQGQGQGQSQSQFQGPQPWGQPGPTPYGHPPGPYGNQPSSPYGYQPSSPYGYGGTSSPYAQSGWGNPPTTPASAPLSPDQLAVQLEKLNELRISGILTEDEFNAQKAKLLARM